MILRVKKVEDYWYLSKTFWKNFKDAFDSTYKTNSDNDVFLEFWLGRIFIGGLCGVSYYNEELYIDYFFINKHYRKQGYGKEIIDYLKEKYDNLSLETVEESFGFYKKCGFIKRKRQDYRLYKNTIDMHMICHRRKKKE